MASHLKKISTQITGLEVALTPRKTLTDLYQQTLTVLGNLPAGSVYRRHTEEMTRQRLDAVQTEENPVKLEERINCGQIEEVIVQAKDELSLVEKFSQWNSHIALEEQAPHGQWS